MTSPGQNDSASEGIATAAKAAMPDRAIAREELLRSFAMDPANPSLARKLFIAQLNGSEIEEAAQTLSKIRPSLDHWTALECDAQLATHRRDQKAAKDVLFTLCLAPEEATHALVGAANAFYEAGWGTEVERVYRSAAAESGCNPEVGTLYADRLVQHKAWGRRKEIYALINKGDLGRRAFIVYTHSLGERKKRDLVLRLLNRYGEWLRGDLRTWAAAGYALVSCGLFKKNIRWMKDWRTRKEVEACHLYYLALSLRHLGRDREARQVSLHAITLPRQDDSRSDHQVWLGLDDALAGRIDSVVERLAEFEGEGLKDHTRLVRTMIKCILDVREAPRPDRRAEFRSVKRRLKRDYLEKIGTGPAELRRAYRRSIWRMAKDAHAWPGLGVFVGPVSLKSLAQRLWFSGAFALLAGLTF